MSCHNTSYFMMIHIHNKDGIQMRVCGSGEVLSVYHNPESKDFTLCLRKLSL